MNKFLAAPYRITILRTPIYRWVCFCWRRFLSPGVWSCERLQFPSVLGHRRLNGAVKLVFLYFTSFLSVEGPIILRTYLIHQGKGSLSTKISIIDIWSGRGPTRSSTSKKLLNERGTTRNSVSTSCSIIRGNDGQRSQQFSWGDYYAVIFPQKKHVAESKIESLHARSTRDIKWDRVKLSPNNRRTQFQNSKTKFQSGAGPGCNNVPQRRGLCNL